ncbi:MAG: fumarylacetoacetate hydrolase family protein, partial [Alphaproteobacteria bacterium]|nr:fumarylacetoacetate hydrolase family protein [Alphaproteobacteria bacterium]
LYRQLSEGANVGDVFPFNPREVASPLPRAYQFLDGSAYVNHVELVRNSRGVEMPESFWTDPLMYQGCSDSFHGPCDDLPYISSEEWGTDFEGEVAVIVNDVPSGVSPEQAEKHIKLVMLCNDVSLRLLAMPELKKGFGFVQCKPPSSFSPVAVSTTELGDYWREGRLHLPLRSYLNDERFGEPNAGVDMVFNFAQLVAHAARTRPLAAGTIIGSGTVSNKDRSVGSSCLVEKRTIEKLDNGESTTPFLKAGDTVKIEMLDDYHNSIFGAIEQTMIPHRPASKSDAA